jgi:hypothetical protein
MVLSVLGDAGGPGSRVPIGRRGSFTELRITR